MYEIKPFDPCYDPKVSSNYGPDHVQMTKVNCRLKVNCTNIKKKYLTI